MATAVVVATGWSRQEDRDLSGATRTIPVRRGRLASVECAAQVSNEIIDALDADREPNEIVGDL